MAIVTLLLNRAMGEHPGALVLALFLGALTCTEIGLIYGTASKDTNTLFTLVKTLNILLVGPVIFYLFPGWPQWIAKLFPTYWFLDPIFQVSMRGAGLADIWAKLVVASAICVVLGMVVATLGRRMQASLATE
jgi:ABC-2 type transport system permease protein